MLPVSPCSEKIILKHIMQKDVAKKNPWRWRVNKSKDVNMWFYRLTRYVKTPRRTAWRGVLWGWESLWGSEANFPIWQNLHTRAERGTPAPSPEWEAMELWLTGNSDSAWACQKGQWPPPPIDKPPPTSSSNHGKVVQAGRALRRCQPKQCCGLSPTGN